jgi:hypothetical protein
MTPSPNSTQARAVKPQTVPKRVPSSSRMIELSSAAVAETPAANAASKTIPATALIAPATAAASSTRRRRRSETRGHQTNKRKARAPSATANAAYWTPRATPIPISVAAPASRPETSSATVSSGARPASPIEKTKPPEITCPSAETTR